MEKHFRSSISSQTPVRMGIPVFTDYMAKSNFFLNKDEILQHLKTIEAF